MTYCVHHVSLAAKRLIMGVALCFAALILGTPASMAQAQCPPGTMRPPYSTPGDNLCCNADLSKCQRMAAAPSPLSCHNSCQLTSMNCQDSCLRTYNNDINYVPDYARDEYDRCVLGCDYQNNRCTERCPD